MDEPTIGGVIWDLRRKRGMTQEQLAEKVGVSPPAVSKWETGASCPDIGLLAPIARALDTDVNTLLSFAADFPQERYSELMTELRDLAKTGGDATLDRMEALLRRYPNDCHLRFQLSTLATGLPAMFGWTEAAAARGAALAKESLDFVHRRGDPRLAPSAAYLLASLHLKAGALDQAEALLNTLPEAAAVSYPLYATLYATLYRRRGDRKKARETLQLQLLQSEQALLTCLAAMSSLDYADTEAEARQAWEAHCAVSQALGHPPTEAALLSASLAMEAGRQEEALDRLEEAVSCLQTQAGFPHRLWSEPVPQEGAAAYRRYLAQMLQSALRSDPAFAPVREDPRYLALLQALET